MTTEKYNITGMACSACAAHVEKSVSKLDGMREVSVNLLTNSMSVEFDETVIITRYYPRCSRSRLQCFLGTARKNRVIVHKN